MGRRLVPTLIGLSLCIAQSVRAQSSTKLSGRVTDRSSGNGLANAELIRVSDSRSFLTDTLGNYEIRDLSGGVFQFLVRAPQFRAVTIIVELKSGEQLISSVILDSAALAQTLPEVAVTAEAHAFNYRLVDFERRRLHGYGQYRNEEELVKSGAYTLQDAVISMRGVNVDCSKTTPAGAGCKIHMVRSPTNCQPEYIVDSRLDNMFGPTTPIRDIVALEVYTGPSDVPGEFAGHTSGCGVIVIWTRSGPTRKPR